MQAWRLIDSGKGDASYNMALDEALALSVRKGESLPVLRFYGWESPSVTIGCFQRVSDIDHEYCSSQGIPVVRRPTGGRAVLHGSELTYSLSARTDIGPFSGGLRNSYLKISAAFQQAFQALGLRAEPQLHSEKGAVLSRSSLCFGSGSLGEIMVNNVKAVGSAQKRWRDSMLQQGSVPFLQDEERTKRICTAGRNVSNDNQRGMAGLRDAIPDLEEAGLKKALIAAFQDLFSVRLVLSAPTQPEMGLARDLQVKKYLLDSWNLILPHCPHP